MLERTKNDFCERTWAMNRPPVPGVAAEYAHGWGYWVLVIEVGGNPVPLAPSRRSYSKSFRPSDDFLAVGLKSHPDTKSARMEFEEDPTLVRRLQEIAVNAFHSNEMQDKNWCSVDIRVPPSTGNHANMQSSMVTGVNPMPPIFLPPSHTSWGDASIRNSFPGGHRALIDTLVAAHLLQRRTRELAEQRVAKVYDGVSGKYDANIAKMPRFNEICDQVFGALDFSQGSILDLGAGTGVFGRKLLEKLGIASSPNDNDSSMPVRAPRKLTLTAIELSEGMVAKCQGTNAYDKIHLGSMQALVCSDRIQEFDHIVSFSALYFLPAVDFSLVMVRAFQLARKSIAVWIDEIPADYEARLREVDPTRTFMAGHNHLALMDKTFCEPAPRVGGCSRRSSGSRRGIRRSRGLRCLRPCSVLREELLGKPNE